MAGQKQAADPLYLIVLVMFVRRLVTFGRLCPLPAGAFAAGVHPNLPIATTWQGLWRALTSRASPSSPPPGKLGNQTGSGAPTGAGGGSGVAPMPQEAPGAAAGSIQFETPPCSPSYGSSVHTIGAQLKSRAQLSSELQAVFGGPNPTLADNLGHAAGGGGEGSHGAGPAAAEALLMVSGSHPVRTLPLADR